MPSRLSTIFRTLLRFALRTLLGLAIIFNVVLIIASTIASIGTGEPWPTILLVGLSVGFWLVVIGVARLVVFLQRHNATEPTSHSRTQGPNPDDVDPFLM